MTRQPTSDRERQQLVELALTAVKNLRKTGGDPDELFGRLSPSLRNHIKHHRWEDWQRAMGQTQRPYGDNLFCTGTSEDWAIGIVEGMLQDDADRVVITRRSQVDWEVEGEWR